MAIKKKLNIVILGSTGAIGTGLAKKFYEDGENITLFYKNHKKAIFLKNKFKSRTNQKIQFRALNVLDAKNIKKQILKNKKIFKSCDILINTVGEHGEVKNFFKLDLNKLYKTFNINFFSYIYFFRYLYPIIKTKKNFLIIIFSGGGTTSLRENFSSYTLSKIALVKLSEILAKEFHNNDIRINSISPGVINSKMTREILKNKKNLVAKKEMLKIKKFIKYSDKSINKIYLLIKFLNSKRGRKISGKMISSMWDKPTKWNSSKINKIATNNFLTLRRKEI